MKKRKEETASAGKSSSKKLNLPRFLYLAGTVYTAWLAWLAYVAWVNISAGNQ